MGIEFDPLANYSTSLIKEWAKRHLKIGDLGQGNDIDDYITHGDRVGLKRCTRFCQRGRRGWRFMQKVN
jgi:hypothetical protein